MRKTNIGGVVATRRSLAGEAARPTLMSMSTLFQRWMHWFAIFLAFWTLLLVVAGGLVTSNDAGLSVPDWPLSYGKLMPKMEGGIFYEHGHRMVATFDGMLMVAMCVWLWMKDERRWMKWLGFIALFSVIFQGVLGGLTVIYLLPPAV